MEELFTKVLNYSIRKYESPFPYKYVLKTHRIIVIRKISLRGGDRNENLGFRIEEGGGRLPIPTHHFFERRKL